MSATRNRRDPVDLARERWGDPLPDWIAALAEASAGSSYQEVAERLGYASGSVVYEALARSYRGPLEPIEAAVRAVLMSGDHHCPGLDGPITGEECRRWQRAPYSAANRHRIAMYRACRGGCPHNQIKPKGRHA